MRHPALAGPGQRLGAYLLDVLFLTLAVLLILSIVGRADKSNTDAVGATLALLAFPVIYGGYFVYEWLCLGTWGATPGKRIVGITVVRKQDAGPLGYGRAAGRAGAQVGFVVISLVTLIASMLDDLWLVWDEQSQCLHDKIAGTLVFRNEYVRPGGQQQHPG